ncbi:MAG: radical SAM protein [Candidatus Omnitrophica bacterium]|nr:radical SAM protein [Candidatus Omnitrophota bacterium]
MRKWSGFKPFQAINDLLWPVAVFYLLDAWSPVAAFQLPADWVWGEQVAGFILKIILSAFFYGFIVDMAIQKDARFSFAAFKSNIRTFWAFALLFAVLPYSLHFIFYIFAKSLLPLHLVQAVVQPLIAILWLRVVLAFKHVSDKKGRKVILDRKGWLSVVIAVLVYYAAYAVYFFTPDHVLRLKWVSILLLKYVELWMYVVFLYAVLRSIEWSRPEVPAGRQIVLVNPPFGGLIQDGLTVFTDTYPFVFVVLKALTPVGYTFREYNRTSWRDDQYAPGSLVAITCLTNNAIEAYSYAKEFRKRGNTVVMGGAHVTAFPDEALEFCDAVVIGPAENVWGKLVEDHEQGRLQKTYAAAPTCEKYEQVMNFLATQPSKIIADCLETTRGCKFNCYFCGGGHLRIGHHTHAIDLVVGLIEKAALYRRRVSFIDDNIYSDPAYAKELFSRLKALNIQWEGNCSLDIAKDPEAVRLCKESGCMRLAIGYEIFPGSREVVRGGKFLMADDYIKLTRQLQKAGIRVKANLMYGSVTDGFAAFWKMWWFVIRLFPRGSLMTLLTPKPNSAFYEDISRQDDFINLNWNKVNGYSLTYRHPCLNNPLFRDGFIFVATFFFLTTSFLGRFILICFILLLPYIQPLLSLR